MARTSKNEALLLANLPKDARDFVIGINKATHSPIPLILTCLLTTNSASLGGGARVSYDGWEPCPNLYGLAVAPSGVGKSAGVKPIIEPLDSIQKGYREIWEKTRLTQMSELDIVTIQLDQLKTQIKKSGTHIDKELRSDHARLTAEKEHLQEITSRATIPLLSVNDFTEEALALYTSKQPFGSIFLVTAEGRNVMKIIAGRYGGNGSTAETFLIMAYTGDPLAVTRLSRAELIIEAHIAMFIAVQEDVFEESLRSPTFTQSGLFPRCLIFRHYERIKVQPTRKPLCKTLSEWWRNHLQKNYDHFRDLETPKTFRFSNPAKELLREEEIAQLKSVQKMSKVHDSYVARHLENLIKITVNLHNLACGLAGINKTIQSSTVNQAIVLMSFYREEQRKILQDSERLADETLKVRLIDLLAENEEGSLTLRELKTRNSISNQDCERMVEKYPDQFYIEKIKPGKKGGRPSLVMRLL